MEMQRLPFLLTEWPDLLILAGDIGSGTDGIRIAQSYFPPEIPKIVLLGNHEAYGHRDLKQLIAECRAAARRAERIDFLENDVVVRSIEDQQVRIVGTTLWTDFAALGPETTEASMAYASQRISDYRNIWLDGRKLIPTDTVDLHWEARAFLETELARSHDGPTIVVTHHAPSLASQHTKYAGDRLSPAFVSDLNPMIERFQPTLWVHGHTHASCDYRIGHTRVYSNQLGYPGENAGFSWSSIEI
jgi:Icc-related predicted phosphoesterase